MPAACIELGELCPSFPDFLPAPAQLGRGSGSGRLFAQCAACLIIMEQPVAGLDPRRSVDQQTSVVRRRDGILCPAHCAATPLFKVSNHGTDASTVCVFAFCLFGDTLYEDVNLADRAKFSREPFQLFFHRLGLRPSQRFLEYRDCGAQPANSNAHLMNCAEIAVTKRSLVGGDLVKAGARDDLE